MYDTAFGVGKIIIKVDLVLIQEFIVHTPHPLAQKYWITNGESQRQDQILYIMQFQVLSMPSMWW